MSNEEENLLREQLSRNIKRIIDAIDLHKSVTEPMKLTPESPINGSFYEAVSMAVNGFNPAYQHWIEWFILENDCGKNGLKAGFDLIQIKTVSGLVELIIAESKDNE